MSEAINWAIKPWEWQKAPLWWLERLNVYWAAKAHVWPEVQWRRQRQQQRMIDAQQQQGIGYGG